MLAYYGSHIVHTAVASFDVVLVEKGVLSQFKQNDVKLCLAEKLHIIKRSNNNVLNKRSELVSKCRHENKFYLGNN